MNTNKILVIEDDYATSKLLNSFLNKWGYEHIIVSSEVQALNFLNEGNTIAIIIDVRIPSGEELFYKMIQHPKTQEIPIIVTKIDPEQQVVFLLTREVDYLFEPEESHYSVFLEDLEEKIQVILKNSGLVKKEELKPDPMGPKILLAEDYKHAEIIVTRLLKKNGFENVVVVENGEKAVKTAGLGEFDLILMDMLMPIMNGHEAIKEIRQIPGYETIPIISLTPFAMKGDREKCFESGATDYIPKPIDSKEFIDKVKYYTNLN